MARIELTRRAILDIADIEQYSLKEWGPRVADEYLVDLSAALERLGESPQLLRERPEIFPRLRFYRVRKHFLVGDVIGDRILVLTVVHGSMDLPKRLAELEPLLLEEVELLHRRIAREEP